MWSDIANCYAYACDCKKPANPKGGAIPGHYADQGAVPGPGEAYVKALIEGVIADGRKNDKAISPPTRDLEKMPELKKDSYLIALISNNAGFHFYRRDEKGEWSWKDGNLGEVESKVYSLSEGKTISPVDTATFQKMVASATKNNYVTKWKEMTFRGYFEIPNGGMTVSGDANVQQLPP